MNNTLQTLIEKVAAEVGCATTAVVLRFQDYGPQDGGFTWVCDVVSKGKPRDKNRRPSFMGSGDSPEAAVEDLLACNGYLQWKDPEAFEKAQKQAADLATFRELLDEGTITQEQHDKLAERAGA